VTNAFFLISSGVYICYNHVPNETTGTQISYLWVSSYTEVVLWLFVAKNTTKLRFIIFFLAV